MAAVATVAALLLADVGVGDAAVRPLVELASCARPSGTTASPGGPGQTGVSFQVSARTRLRLDGGRVAAANTNTGCAPRPTDSFLTGDRRSTPAEVRAALAHFRSGNWTSPGTWHRAS